MKIYQNNQLEFAIKPASNVKIWHNETLEALNGAADLNNPQRLTQNQLITRPYYDIQTRQLNCNDPRIYHQLVHEYHRLFDSQLGINQHRKIKLDMPSLDQFISQNQTLISGIVAQKYTPNTLLYLLDLSDFVTENVTQIDTYLRLDRTVSRLTVDAYLGVANNLNQDESHDLSTHLNQVLTYDLAVKLQAQLTVEPAPKLVLSDAELSNVALAKGEYFMRRIER